MLSRDLLFTPGTNYNYNDGSPQLISGVIQKVSGKTEEEFARENLFVPWVSTIISGRLMLTAGHLELSGCG